LEKVSPVDPYRAGRVVDASECIRGDDPIVARRPLRNILAVRRGRDAERQPHIGVAIVVVPSRHESQR
jgi:hypothetical protein